jgi:hypothetical protein
MSWLSFLNPMDGIIEWGGYDPSANKDYLFPNEYKPFTLTFKALKPQSEWATSPLYTTRKFCGNNGYVDMNIGATNGIMVVYRLKSTLNQMQQYFIVYPNPTTGDINIDFEVKEIGEVKLYVTDLSGKIVKMIVDKNMETGRYTLKDNIQNLNSGVYFTSYATNNNLETTKIVKN